MLSILIPTYNYDCTCLVGELQCQAEQACIDYEIIVADDASPIPLYKEKNREINSLPHCRFIELEENRGRARIRNLLANEAQHEWLLFMDADAKVITPSFIADYLNAITERAEVICGGLCHANTLPSPTVSLRYAYEKHADKRRAARYRAEHPYERFTPFNFLIRRATFQAIRFDESITEYGHEDTLFGIELQYREVPLLHIDNPLQHMGLEANEVFLRKTRTALRNLSSMESTMQGYSSLISAYQWLCRLHLSKPLSYLYSLCEAALTAHLCSAHPMLSIFFIYKLGYYCQLKHKIDSIN